MDEKRFLVEYKPKQENTSINALDSITKWIFIRNWLKPFFGEVPEQKVDTRLTFSHILRSSNLFKKRRFTH